jgi:predicted PurR-regulated permease PerM
MRDAVQPEGEGKPEVAAEVPGPARSRHAVEVDIAVEAAIRIGLVAALLLLCWWIVRPFAVPIAWGVILAVATWPAYERLLRLLGGRRALSSTLFVVAALLLLLVPIGLLSGTLVEGANWLAKGFEAGDLHIPPPPDLSHVPLFGEQVEAFWRDASTNFAAVLKSLEPQIRVAGAWLLSLAASAGMGLLHFVLAILIAAVLLAKSETGRRAADAIGCRLAGARGLQFARLSEAVVRSVSRGILGVALIQSLLAGLGMLAAGVPLAGLWALVALLLATIQVGAFPVLLPAMIYLFYAGDLTTAVLFAIWSLFVGSIDNILKPILLGRGISVPMAVIFVGAIGGFISAGIIGLFVGAVILVLGYELFLAWLSESEPAELRERTEAAAAAEKETAPSGDGD